MLGVRRYNCAGNRAKEGLFLGEGEVESLGPKGARMTCLLYSHLCSLLAVVSFQSEQRLRNLKIMAISRATNYN